MAGTGLQHKTIYDILDEVDMEKSQAMALFNKAIKRISKAIRDVYMKEAEQKFEKSKTTKLLKT